jgi:hypothetical protein
LGEAFTGAAQTSSDLAHLPLATIREGFRSLWCRGSYAEILALAERLPREQLAGDETVLMYALCAARKAASLLRTIPA